MAINIFTFGQFVTIPNESMKSNEYAISATNNIAMILSLDSEQKQQTYLAILERKKTYDSLTINGISVDPDKMWALYFSLDKKFKHIFSERQYLEFDQKQRGGIIYTYLVPLNKSIDTKH